MTINILIVEDDNNQLRLYEKAVNRWNKSEEKKFEIAKAINKSQAQIHLNNQDFDAAILDLRLPGDTSDHASGNDILSIIKKELRYPVYVVSANINDLDGQFDDHPFIEAFSRGNITPEELLRKIFKRYSTGITNILGKKGKFEEALNIVFWNHISHAISHWEEAQLPSNVKEKQLLRYTLSHLQEILALDELGKDEKCNTAEIYIKPPIRTGIAPGLVIKKEGESYLVITPACDISQGRAEYFQLLKMFMLERLPEIMSKGKSKSRAEFLKALVKNSKDRFHFIPAYGSETDMIVDFQHITTIEKNKNVENFEFSYTISAPFFKDVVNRFSSYYARQGSPDFDAELLSDMLNSRLHEHPIK